MANETPITLTGRLTADPELRFTPGGDPVVEVNIACNERRFNKDTQEWEDGTPVFWRGSMWREPAERVAETLHRGDAVVAYGFVEGRSWEDRETGKTRYAQQVQIQGIGPDLRWMDVTGVSKAGKQGQGAAPRGQGQAQPAPRGGSTPAAGNAQQGRAQRPPAGPRPAAQPEADPWGGGGNYDEPPF